MTEDKTLRFANHLPCQTLTRLTLEQLPRDGSLGRIRRFRKGANIWRPNDAADRIYFLKRGQVVAMTSDSEGNEVIMQVIGAGEPFGELCFCSQERGLLHTLGRAVVESEALEIQYRDFVRFLQKNPDAMMSLIFTFCERLGEMERRVEVLAQRGAEDRLGRLLLQLASPPGRPKAHLSIAVPASFRYSSANRLRVHERNRNDSGY